MVSGSLASVSNLEMLNGANVAALIRADGNAERIQFQTSRCLKGSIRSPRSCAGAAAPKCSPAATPWATCSSCSPARA